MVLLCACRYAWYWAIAAALRAYRFLRRSEFQMVKAIVPINHTMPSGSAPTMHAKTHSALMARRMNRSTWSPVVSQVFTSVGGGGGAGAG